MEVKQIWMSPGSGKNNHYALHLGLGIIGIAMLILFLVGVGTVMSFSLGFPRKTAAVGLCVGCTILAAVLARKLGTYANNGAAVFFLTADDRLFAIDARGLPFWDGNVLSRTQTAVQIQEYLRRLARKPAVPSEASEICKVLSLRERPWGYRVICQVRRPGRQIFRAAFSFSSKWEGAEQLLRQLERRETWQSRKPAAKNRIPALLAALAGAVILLGVCILSHPAQGILPEELYYPGLAGEVAAVTLVSIFWTMHTRGE